MKTNKLGRLNIVIITVALASTMLVAASLFGLLHSDSGTGSNKNVTSSNNAKTDDTSLRPILQPIQQAQNGIVNAGPSGNSLNTPLANNGGTENPAKTPSTSTDSSARPQPRTSTTPPVSKPTKTKLTDLKTAENQVYTSDNRLFVTGNGGIFEIVARSASDVSIVDHTPKQRNCDFGGIVELSGVLYVNCSTLGPSYIYAAALAATPSFKQIYAFKSAILPNGLTTDNSGNLYDASMFAGRILRLTPSVANPLTFAKTEVWLNNTGLLTDGIKFYNGSIYWTDGRFLKSVSVKADGTPGRQTRLLSTAPTILDDLTIDNDGILVADHLYGVIRKYDLNGRSTGTIPAKFTTPSSVVRARAPFPAGSLIVTERSANQVTLFTP